MEIRILRIEELGIAAGLSRFVFDTCLRNRMEFIQTISFIEDYLQQNHLQNLYEENKLIVWGAFEQEQMVGVCGLQSDGMITMLYVLPQFANKGIGSSLLNTMRVYARDIYGLEKVLLNATPSWTAFYFVKQGFSYMYPNQNMRVPFVPLYARSKDISISVRRRIPKKYILLSVFGCIALATLAAWGFMMWYL